MEILSVRDIVSEEKVCVRVEASISCNQMYVTQEKNTLQREIAKLEAWAATQRFENMDLSVHFMPGKRSILLMYLTVGRVIGLTPWASATATKETTLPAVPNNDYDTFRHQHQFVFSWCSNCPEGCQYFDLEITNCRPSSSDIAKRLSFDSVTHAQAFALCMGRAAEFVAATAHS